MKKLLLITLIVSLFVVGCGNAATSSAPAQTTETVPAVTPSPSDSMVEPDETI